MKNVIKAGKSHFSNSKNPLFYELFKHCVLLLPTDLLLSDLRFTGIDPPESVAEDKNKNTEDGKITSEFLKELL